MKDKVKLDEGEKRENELRQKTQGKQGGGTDNPHDKRLKALFANKEAVLSLIKDCVGAKWADEIDMDSLKQTNRTFIMPDFGEREVDVIYEATVGGRKVYFYLLIELQRKVDYRMGFRLMVYIVQILLDYYKNADEKARKRKGFKFPVVFPLMQVCHELRVNYVHICSCSFLQRERQVDGAAQRAGDVCGLQAVRRVCDRVQLCARGRKRVRRGKRERVPVEAA